MNVIPSLGIMRTIIDLSDDQAAAMQATINNHCKLEAIVQKVQCLQKKGDLKYSQS